MKFCKHCGAETVAEQKFCTKCGKEYAPTAAQPTTTVPYPQPAPAGYYQPPPMPTKLPGSSLIRIPGIIYIAAASLAVLFNGIMLLIINDWLPYYGGEVMRGIWQAFYATALLGTAYALFMAIMCVVFHNKADKSSLLMILSIIALAMVVIVPVIQSVVGTNSMYGDYIYLLIGYLIISLPFTVTLPLLCLIGAIKNGRVPT